MRYKKRVQRGHFSGQVLFLGSLLVMFALGLTGCTGLGIHFAASPTPAVQYTLTHCNGQPVPMTRSALAAATGKTLWSTYMSTFSGLVADSSTGLVYCGARVELSTLGTRAVLLALTASTGKLQWQYQTGGPTIPSVPIVDQNILYFTGDGVYAVNALNGARRWHTPLEASPS